MEMKFDYRNKNVGDKSIIFVEYIINRLYFELEKEEFSFSLSLSNIRDIEVSTYTQIR